MLNFFRKGKELEIVSPVNGVCVSLSQVPDKMFSQKMLGDGIAFVYDDEVVSAPCDGVITMIAKTKHAFGIQASNGAEVLIHIGLNTVSLEGKGFEMLVHENQIVKVGDNVLKVNQSLFKENGLTLITPVVVTNTEEFEFSKKIKDMSVQRGEVVLSLYKK